MNLDGLRKVRDENPIGSKEHNALQWAIEMLAKAELNISAMTKYIEEMPSPQEVKDLRDRVKCLQSAIDHGRTDLDFVREKPKSATFEDIYSLEDKGNQP